MYPILCRFRPSTTPIQILVHIISQNRVRTWSKQKLYAERISVSLLCDGKFLIYAQNFGRLKFCLKQKYARCVKFITLRGNKTLVKPDQHSW